MHTDTKNVKNKQRGFRLLAFFALTIFIFASVGFFAYRYLANETGNENQTPTKINNVNYSPPTDEEKKTGDQIKQSVIEQQTTDKTTNSTKPSDAEVIITDAGQYDDVIEVRAFVQNVYLDGTCTITFKKDALIVTRQTPAYRDATTTICTNPEFKRSEFQAAGQWTVTVKYEAPGSTGTSESKIINVQ